MPWRKWEAPIRSIPFINQERGLVPIQQREVLMVDHGNIVRVIIASPSDIVAERKAIPKIFARWNSNHDDIHLEPVMSETSATPSMGDHPQHLLNKELIGKGDLLIAIFWSKIGTPTPTAESGTIEEIREFIKLKGPFKVMVYFCTRHLEEGPGELNPDELTTLQDFKKEMQAKCFYKEFTTTDSFAAELYPDLDAKVKQLLRGEIPEHNSQDSPENRISWFENNHPDPRLRQPLELGSSLDEIAKNFSIRMSEFEKIDGATNDRFLSLGFHVYMSAAKAIEHEVLLREYQIPYQTRLKYKAIAKELEDLANSRSIENFTSFFEKGVELSEKLNGMSDT